ncbi:N-acetyl-1-D-myo-inositol-2-amino-2-deoxy-alpha-D-glucopyranoside deacetylase [Euzebya tangerina]|uniref:N-acetyl-1-D-myo-inositol-2-amino-2-deoxy-alpha- D-glucopyranoside deacetylase n=1 Tax=Euzebya tangerina TaxID=591198 RepID=UPI000E31187B|nr:N-acetyl-1-D-myo-inositol-2-amino-2-deoxy-alpha-D-glucopyranoside deacetylase [Euzebya tangerina]
MSAAPGLLAIHAHPDDEVIGTGGVLARAAAEGRRVKVLTCTDGKRGEIVGEGMDEEEIRPRLAEVRAEEIANALSILEGPGSIEHEFLGYADSDMMGRDGNYDPANFWQADMHEAVGKVVRVIREFRPSVVVTYDAFGGYGHPDHIQAHRVTVLACEAAGMKVMYPEAGAPWRTPKLYLTAFPKSRIAEANQMFIDRGLPSPFGEYTDPDEIPMGTPDDLITTRVDVTPHIEVKRDALHAHVSQIAPDSFFMNVPDDMMEGFYGHESFVRRWSEVGTPDGVEDDLFAGL